jgi:dTDP-4-amino-4,6-dideoxygalactose transaminase
VSNDVVFNRPFATGSEHRYIQEAIDNGYLSGNGPFGRRCAGWLCDSIGSTRACLTPSATSALEMATLLGGIGPGDEVVMPSFTFVSTANAVVLRGATPVFIDIRDDTLNIDEEKLEAAITERTVAVLPVHYAGVGCEMDAILDVARTHDLIVIEDAAQGLGATYRGRPLGGIGDLGALSFHETKNVQCGEGGALLVNSENLVARAEIVQEKGTDRQRFFRGQVDKYTWVDMGSSFLLSEVNAAFLWAQLEAADEIGRRRMRVWERYHETFAPLEELGLLRRPIVPDHCRHNAHMYYVLLPAALQRDGFIASLSDRGVQAVFHYVPLHDSQAGERFGRSHGELPVTNSIAERLVRLPLWVEMTDSDVSRVIEAVAAAVNTAVPSTR